MDKSQQDLLRRFERLVSSGRMAHAYLFIGPSLVGKTTMAFHLAKLINAGISAQDILDGRDEENAVASRIEARNHPDVQLIELEEEETSIKIQKVRELIGRSQLRPFEAEKKIFIVRDAETMTTDGANALLKTLEEPTSTSLLILTTAHPEKILSTVRSRCQAVHFFPLLPADVEKELQKTSGVQEEQAHFLALYSEGCLGQALRLHEEKFFDRKNEIIDNMVYKRNNENDLKDLGSDKGLGQDTLKVLLSWFRDVMLLKIGVEESRLMNKDRILQLRQEFQRYSVEQLDACIDQIVETFRMMEENLNVKIPFILLREKIWARL